MATQFSLSYDSAGTPRLVENKIEFKNPTVKEFNIDPFKPKRTLQTDFSFTDSPQEEEVFGPEAQLTILKRFINDNDAAGPDVTDDSFDALAAKDDTGKIKGSLTFKEKATIAAFQYSQLPGIVKFGINSFTPFPMDIIDKIGQKSIDPYYDPEDPMFNYTGFGADLAEGDVSKPGMGYEAAYGSKFSKTTAIAEASEVAYSPKDNANVTGRTSFDNPYSGGSTGIHGNNDGSSGGGHAGGSAAADAAASQAADDEAAGRGGY